MTQNAPRTPTVEDMEYILRLISQAGEDRKITIYARHGKMTRNIRVSDESTHDLGG